LVDVTIGVSGFGRGSEEASGITNRRRFSYKAKRFNKRAGTVDDL
jgi:hypothetical protein